MSFPEFANQDGGLGRVEQLGVIRSFWVPDAARVNASTGTTDERLARSRYVVDLLAMLEWEREGRSEDYIEEERAQRLNDMYLGGLLAATDAYGGTRAAAAQYSPGEWEDYLRTQIYPRITYKGKVAPANHFELMLAVHEGTVQFDYQSVEPTS